MHYKYLYGDYETMRPYAQYIEKCIEQTTNSSCSYENLSKPIEGVYWILITDAFFDPIATCMIKQDGRSVTKHNVAVSDEWKNTGFKKRLDEMIETFRNFINR